MVTLVALLQLSHGDLKVFSVLVTSGNLGSLWVLFATYILVWFLALIPIGLAWLCAAYFIGQISIGQRVSLARFSRMAGLITVLAFMAYFGQTMLFTNKAYEGVNAAAPAAVLTIYSILYMLAYLLHSATWRIIQGRVDVSTRGQAILKQMAKMGGMIRWAVRLLGMLLVVAAVLVPIVNLNAAVPRELVMVEDNESTFSLVRGVVINVDDTRLLLVDADGLLHSIPNGSIEGRFPNA